MGADDKSCGSPLSQIGNPITSFWKTQFILAKEINDVRNRKLLFCVNGINQKSMDQDGKHVTIV